MMNAVNDPIAHTNPWATEENFWLEGPDFYRAHMAEGAAMWFPDRDHPLTGEAILDALQNAPRWEDVVFCEPSLEVEGDRVILRYHATARREGHEVYTARCLSIYVHVAGALKLVENRQRAV